MVYDGDMPDEDDRVFYEVSLSEEDSFLVTGNLKHFPKTPIVITAAQMMEIFGHRYDGTIGAKFSTKLLRMQYHKQKST